MMMMQMMMTTTVVVVAGGDGDNGIHSSTASKGPAAPSVHLKEVSTLERVD